MRHFISKKIIFISLLILTNINAFGQNFQNSFKELEKKLEEQTSTNIQNSEQQLIATIQSKMNFNVELENGTFLVYIPARESFDSNEIKLFGNNKEIKKSFTDIFSRSSYGTGFLYKNYVVTNYHVCRGRNVLLKDYNEKILHAKVLGYNIIQDICVLSIKNYKNYDDFSVKKITASSFENDRSFASTNTKSLTIKAKVYSMWGEFSIFNIKKDFAEDVYSKTNGMTGINFENRCIGGISGSPVVGVDGLKGIMWGSDTDDNPTPNKNCFFLKKEELDKVIFAVENSK